MNIFKYLCKNLSSRRTSEEVPEIIKKVAEIAFPRGKEQIDEEAVLVYAILNKKVPIEDVKRILIRTKADHYVHNFKRSDNTIIKNNEVLRNSTEISLSDADLDLIYRFYENYFGFKSELFKEEYTDSNINSIGSPPCENDDLTINLQDQNGTYWGSVEFKGEKILWTARSGDGGGFYAFMLFLAITAARQKMSSDDKDEFASRAALPEGRWTEKHYLEFAFSGVKWLSEANEEIENNNNLKKVKEWLCQSGECDLLNYNFNNAVRRLFVKTFGNSSEQS